MTKDIQAAKKLLQENAISNKAVPPAQLVSASNQLGKSLQQTLNLIAFLKTNGQGYGPFPQTAKALTGEYQ